MDLPRHLEKEIKTELKEPRKTKIKLRAGNQVICETEDVIIADINPSSRYNDEKRQRIEATFRSNKDAIADNAELTYYSKTEKERVLRSVKAFQPIFMKANDSLTITWEMTWE